MRHFASEHIGDGLDPAVRMPGKARQIVIRNVVAKVVQQEKGVELRSVPEPESTAQVHARAFESRLRLNQALNRSNGHDMILCCSMHAVLKEAVKVNVDELLMSRAHAVRKPGVNLQSRSLHQFGGKESCGADRHDLIVISVKNKRGHVDLLQIFREIGLGKRLNTVKRRLEACLHPL